jgi:16S rRNA (guanine527-N7)-methyltransferase
MTATEISEALAPFLGSDAELSPDQIHSIRSYLDLLLKWNSRINLTAIREPKLIVTRHFGESFFAARHLPVSSGETAIDIGSGAGFPGLALKIWHDGLKLSLIESSQRKATFLREAVRALGLENVDVLISRAEELTAQADLVTLRAVENFDRILPVMRNMTKPRGRIALLIGSAQVATAKSVLANVDWESALPMPCSQSRILLIGLP